MKKETKEKVVRALKNFIGLIGRHRDNKIEGDKLDLEKYDRVSGSEWNETLEK